MTPYLGASLAAAAFASSAILTWAVRELALRTNRLDVPNARSAHARPTPRLGGVALMSTFLVVATVACAASADWSAAPVLGATALISAIGLVDDLHPLAARTRLLIQAIAAVFVLWARQDAIGPALAFAADWPRWITLPIATLWIVWMTNLFNFMDGIDGLAGGQAVIGGAALAAVAYSAGQPIVATLALVAAAASLGFLRFNYPPASIFMGDAGSTALGFFFATLPFAAGEAAISVDLVAMAFSMFILDATTTLIRRLLRGERVAEAHRTHLYQRPLDFGVPHIAITRCAYVAFFAVAGLTVFAASAQPTQRLAFALAAVLLFYALVVSARRVAHGHNVALARKASR
ncbi:glycosyl transferase family 4 [Anaeromyxobacter sp. K]|uniref:MraY family glycosyltransferase n=1 Tax=Anaeromyxobacter sp. (strain K) TaxID=447217 RepID=UPI00017BE411|nr:glycosyltransferase family 4 protein [Anaeromyxobacter sp. K]ACG75618.1 glycosyl transferase family 4 [Anaeromyxobacter sp. K]